MTIQHVPEKKAGEMTLSDILRYFHSRMRLRRWYNQTKETNGKGYLGEITKGAGMGNRSSTVSNLISGFIVNPSQLNRLITYANTTK